MRSDNVRLNKPPVIQAEIIEENGKTSLKIGDRVQPCTLVSVINAGQRKTEVRLPGDIVRHGDRVGNTLFIS